MSAKPSYHHLNEALKTVEAAHEDLTYLLIQWTDSDNDIVYDLDCVLNRCYPFSSSLDDVCEDMRIWIEDIKTHIGGLE